MTLALAHGVGGLLHRAATRGDLSAYPASLRHMIARHAAAAERHNQVLLAEQTRLQAVLAGVGIASIPLKGAWLGQRLYDSLAVRVSRDVDLLVREESIVLAWQGLPAAGYSARSSLSPRQIKAKAKYAGQCMLQQDQGDFAFEPHWALGPHTLCLALDYAGLWRRSGLRASGGLAQLTLSAEDEFIMLCVHGFKDEWSRIRLIVDVAQFVCVHTAMDWSVVETRAREQRVWWIVLVACLLMSAMFGIDTNLLATARTEKQPARLARRILVRLDQAAATPRKVAEPVSIYRVSAMRLMMREHGRDRLRYVWRTMTTPREQHFLAVALPDRLFPAYVGVKLVHDYLALPCWRAGKGLCEAVARRWPLSDPVTRLRG